MSSLLTGLLLVDYLGDYLQSIPINSDVIKEKLYA